MLGNDARAGVAEGALRSPRGRRPQRSRDQQNHSASCVKRGDEISPPALPTYVRVIRAVGDANLEVVEGVDPASR